MKGTDTVYSATFGNHWCPETCQKTPWRLKQFPSTVKVYLCKVPSIHTACEGERNKRNSGQLPSFQDPPTSFSITCSTCHWWENCSWRVCLKTNICIIQLHLNLIWPILTNHRLFITNKGTHAWALIGEGELGHTLHGVHIGPCSEGTK